MLQIPTVACKPCAAAVRVQLEDTWDFGLVALLAVPESQMNGDNQCCLHLMIHQAGLT